MVHDKNEVKPFCLYVGEADMEKLRVIGRKEERTGSYMIRSLVKTFLKKHEDDNGKQTNT